MKVVTCFTPGQLRPETIEALARHWTDVSLHLIDPDDPFAYRRIISRHWALGESFAVVEPDIVIRADVADAFKHCSCLYGCFPYAWTTDVGPALGCTWFRAEFLYKYPTAVSEVGNIAWNQLDVVLMRHILARKYGEQPHVHLPAVRHLNEQKQLLPEADPTPLMSVPHW